ncbi:unnamed protein product [Heterobilharzia americana]|nr:unnamed protein product [Heterobilharzia americana]
MMEAKNSEVSLPAAADSNSGLQLQSNPLFSIPPRAIIRNKVSDLNASIFGRDILSQAGSLDNLDFLDGHQNANSPNLMRGADRCPSRDVSIINTLNSQRVTDNDQPKLEQSLRGLASSQSHSAWPFTQHRSTALPESGRSNELSHSTQAPGGYRRLSVRTPLIPSPILSGLLAQRGCQANIWLKLENIQPTGSFKIRGVENLVRKGLWRRGWSSTQIITAETEGADCLNRSLKSGQLAVIPRSSTIATSINAPVLAQHALNLAQCHPVTAVTCTDTEAVDGVKRLLDDHGMLVDPACGAALSTVYSGYLSRLQHEGCLSRPSNIVIIIGGGRNVSLRQLIEWENQFASFAPEQIAASVLPPISNSYITHLTCSEISKPTSIIHHTSVADHEECKTGMQGPSTPRSVCTILSRGVISRPDLDQQTSGCNGGEIENSSECCTSTLNPHDLVNFSKLLASSEAEGEEGSLHE